MDDRPTESQSSEYAMIAVFVAAFVAALILAASQ